MSSQDKPATKNSFSAMSDADLVDTIKTYSATLAEAVDEQRKRRDNLVEKARKEYIDASKKLADLGGFKEISSLPSAALGHGSLFATRIFDILDR